MDPTGTGTKILPFTRSAAVRSKDGLNTREAVNSNTHFIDGSLVCVTRGHLSCPCLFKALRWDGHLTGRRGRLISESEVGQRLIYRDPVKIHVHYLYINSLPLRSVWCRCMAAMMPAAPPCVRLHAASSLWTPPLWATCLHGTCGAYPTPTGVSFPLTRCSWLEVRPTGLLCFDVYQCVCGVCAMIVSPLLPRLFYTTSHFSGRCHISGE